MYQISSAGGGVIRLSDYASIPADPSNNDFIEYKAWVARGNSPLSADPIPVETIIENFVSQIQKRLDDFASTRGYDNILSACTYASSLVPKFKAEGQYCVGARDDTWATGYTLMAEVQSGARPMPTLDEVFAALPTLNWPV